MHSFLACRRAAERAGASCPSELCGLSSLYSCRQCAASAFASRRSAKIPDYPRVQQLVAMPSVEALAVAVLPRRAAHPEHLGDQVADPLARHRPLNLEQQVIARVLVDERQEAQRTPEEVAVLDEVPAPHVVLMHRLPPLDPVCGNAEAPIPAVLPRHAQAIAAAQPVHALVVHAAAVEPQATAHHAVAVPLRRPVLAEHRAGPTLRAPDPPADGSCTWLTTVLRREGLAVFPGTRSPPSGSRCRAPSRRRAA